MITVKVAKLGAQVKEFAMEGTATVGDALKLAGYTAEKHEVRKNNSPCSLGSGLCNGDTVTLVAQIKGGYRS